ncbi:phospholipase D family protein [Methanobrevibacter sp.]|uniref:phospholipase D family protein n=1 Tax=Methanobrevibacter sp. TaxID=66852 RepID=UPI00257C4A15|nr:phospholipase D family protein [Methanobrevibacter sp.]MBR2666503.1 phospholipase D family protein [Methanobrevibacter sp.]
MLNPKNNRIDYGSILSPPNNYELDFAIGTTYSLDLDALVGASISLGLSAESDSDLNENPIFLLEALRSTGDKVALFCESGQIKYPNKTTPLYILLEEMVFQVTNENNVKHSKYASFHPKVWLIRYASDKDEILYRIIVLSRNLTFDRSWDLTFTMDGRKASKSSSKNNPLIKFIEYLTKYSTDDDKTDKIRRIMDELPFVEFELNQPFEGFEFIVNGIDDDFVIQNQQLFTSNSLDKLLIMTPFLSKDVIEDFNSRKNPKSQATLITRMQSLDKDLNLDNFEVYALKDEIVEGESLLSGETENFAKQDIHAKMYVVEKTKYTDLYLGSLNASHNALYGNVEFMIKLGARKRKFNINKVLKEVFNGEADGPDNPFQQIDLNELQQEETDGNNLNLVVKDIVRLSANAKIVENGNKFDIELEFENGCDKYDITVNPLLSNKTSEFSRRMVFKELDKTQLSEFFVITVTKDDETVRRVIKIPVDNLPEDREKEVVSNVIKDKTAFIRYVAFLLGDEYIISSVDDWEGKDSKDKYGGFTIQLPELYEKMLKAAMYEPEKFREIEFLIKMLSNDENVVPEGFDELYNTFKRVIDDE